MRRMSRLFLILVLCPLTAAAADWSYDGQMAAGGGTSAGQASSGGSSGEGDMTDAASTETAMARTAGPAPADAPGNSMTMTEVRASRGDPDNAFEPVGEPPITRWQYPEYVVYFEHDLVITSVAGHW